jgi:Na+/H+ antiporter NhaC
MDSQGFISLIPPLIALGLALWKRRIIPALLIGGLIGALVMANNKWVFIVNYLEKVI